jgi:hypothetical protein
MKKNIIAYSYNISSSRDHTAAEKRKEAKTLSQNEEKKTQRIRNQAFEKNKKQENLSKWSFKNKKATAANEISFQTDFSQKSLNEFPPLPNQIKPNYSHQMRESRDKATSAYLSQNAPNSDSTSKPIPTFSHYIPAYHTPPKRFKSHQSIQADPSENYLKTYKLFDERSNSSNMVKSIQNALMPYNALIYFEKSETSKIFSRVPKCPILAIWNLKATEKNPEKLRQDWNFPHAFLESQKLEASLSLKKNLQFSSQHHSITWHLVFRDLWNEMNQSLDFKEADSMHSYHNFFKNTR